MEAQLDMNEEIARLKQQLADLSIDIANWRVEPQPPEDIVTDQERAYAMAYGISDEIYLAQKRKRNQPIEDKRQ